MPDERNMKALDDEALEQVAGGVEMFLGDACIYCGKPNIYVDHTDETGRVKFYKCRDCGKTFSIFD